jgi:hypothetical protein
MLIHHADKSCEMLTIMWYGDKYVACSTSTPVRTRYINPKHHLQQHKAWVKSIRYPLSHLTSSVR